MIKRSGIIGGSLAVLLFVTNGTSADDTHYRSVPIGAHAIGLAGAFAGVVDDASAAFYNPSGLAHGGARGIAGGLTINAWDRLQVNNAFQNPNAVDSATAKTGRTIPVFIGAALTFGPTDALERKKFALALSVVEPNSSRDGFTVQLRSDAIELTDSYSVGASDRATWYGLSFASRIDLKQSIGGSLYVSQRNLNQAEVGLALGGGTPVSSDPATFVGTSTAANTANLNFNAYHFVLRFGWLYQIKPQVQVGVMLQPPGIPLKQRANVTSQGFFTDNAGPNAPVTTRAYFYDEEVNANLPIPMELRGGLQYWAAEKIMLALDAMFYSPVRSGQRAKVAGPVPTGPTGLFFDNDTARRAIANVALGGDFFISKKVMIEAGFFTDLSSAVNIPANPDRYYNPQINRYGATVSIGLNVAGVALAVGSTFLYGKGPATGAVVDAANLGVGYTRTDASSRSIFLHVTGATRAVSELGDRTAKSVQSRREKKNYEEEPGEQDQ
ncbi:MAG: hypothetical protein WCF10_16445 [Polyangiales bacterium]